MASQVAAARQPFQIDLDHAEQLLRAASAVTIDPLKSIAYYIFPILGAVFSNHVEMRKNDPTQAAMMPEATKRDILGEIENITEKAGLKRGVVPYCALKNTFDSCGGPHSLTTPVLFLPHQHIFRQGCSPFTQESPEEDLARELWRYSDDETRFLICREVGRIVKNDDLIRIAVKVCLLAATFILYATPLGLLGGVVLFALGVGLHLLSERAFQAKMDLVGVEILTKRLGDRNKAFQVAIATLEKMRKQNLERRDQSKLCKYYITKLGNNIFLPFLTKRIERLRLANIGL